MKPFFVVFQFRLNELTTSVTDLINHAHTRIIVMTHFRRVRNFIGIDE